MAKQKPVPIVSRQFSLEDLDLGIKKLSRRLQDLRDIDPAKVRHDDPIVNRIESDVRATILDIFGEQSPEFKEHHFFLINPGPFRMGEPDHETQQHFMEGYPKAVEIVSGLIRRLAEKKEDLQAVSASVTYGPAPARSNRVFLVHGHDEELKSSVARFIEKLRLEAVVLSEQPSLGKTIIEKFEANADVGSAIILLSPDDVGASKGDFSSNPSTLQPRARQNAVLELGYFIGKLGRGNVFAVKKGDIEIPSDLHGVIYIPYDASEGWKLSLAKEMKASGVLLDMNDAI